MNRSFIRTSKEKDDRRRDPAVKAALRGCRSIDEAEDLEDIVHGEPMTENRASWDRRGRYPSNAARRWVKAQARLGRPWDDVRPELIKKLDSVEMTDDLVETTQIVDGEVCINTIFGPKTLDDYWCSSFVYVCPKGILKQHNRPKHPEREIKVFFHFEKDSVWFKLENGAIMRAPLEAIVEANPFHTRAFGRNFNYNPVHQPGFIQTGGNRNLSRQFHEKEIDLTEARQVSPKKAPKEVFDLVGIPKAKP